MKTVALLLALLPGPGLAAPPELQDAIQAVVFEQELERVQAKIEQGNWKSARVQLERALESHVEAPYVFGHLGEIELILKRCTFWEERTENDVAGYLQGELLSYSSGSGKIKLRYKEDEPHDFQQRGLALVHIVEFSGPYSIECEDTTSKSMVVCATPKTSYQVNFSRTFHLGVDNPNRGKRIERQVRVTSRLENELGEVITEEDNEEFTSSRNSRPETYKVAVSSTSVKASFDGKSLLSMKKPRDLWGSLAIGLGGPKGTIVIEGIAERWIKKQRDLAFQEGWQKFAATWNLSEHLPPWMRTALAEKDRAKAPSKNSAGVEPSDLSQKLIRLWNDAVSALNAGEFETVLAKTAELLEAQPEVARARYLRAQAFTALKKRPEAIDALAPCLRHHPAYSEGMSYLARLYLVSGRFEDVLDTVSKAVAAGISPTELQSISITANKAIHGPTWSVKYHHESRHYSVSSDISQERCRQVSAELEETYRHISRRMGVGEHMADRKFQVYAFAGQASYLDYIQHVFGGRGEFTQGMYSPYLKQLLVLDSEPRDSFMHTVRHEGFHQFFDSVLDEPPLWLNEGLAEYFAAARTAQGSWRDGQLNEYRLEHLRPSASSSRSLAQKLKPLAEFFELDQAAFMREGPDNYAQAWVFVHYLRHSSVANKVSFDTLMKSLLGGATNACAVQQAFEGVDLQSLDREFEEFVRKL